MRVFYQVRNKRLVIVDEFDRIIEILSKKTTEPYRFCVMGYVTKSMILMGDF